MFLLIITDEIVYNVSSIFITTIKYNDCKHHIF